MKNINSFPLPLLIKDPLSVLVSTKGITMFFLHCIRQDFYKMQSAVKDNSCPINKTECHTLYLELQFQRLRFENLALCHCHCKLKIGHKSNNVGKNFCQYIPEPIWKRETPLPSQARLIITKRSKIGWIRFCSTIISWWSKLNIHERVELSLTMAMKVTIMNKKVFLD